MATNYKQPGKILTVAAPYNRTSGQGALIGSIFGVALSDVLSGATGDFQTSGVWSLTKTAAQAWALGQKIYWDNVNKVCDSDSTVGQLIGVATEVAANPSSTGVVRLNGVAPATAEGPQTDIVALTDNTGGSGTHDDTLADGLTVTSPAALTATSPGTGADASTWTGAQCTAAYNDLVALRAKIDTLVTDVTVQNQNDSDLAQKILEIRTALINAGILAAS